MKEEKRKANPLIDCVFKKLFGTEENKDLLISLINSIMEIYKKPLVEEIELLNPYNLKEFGTDKMSIVDIKARDERGEWFIIEVQIQMYRHYPKRILYYWGDCYTKQLSGEQKQYRDLKKVTIISVSERRLPIKTTSYLSKFTLREEQSNVLFCEDIEVYTIEIEKFPRRLEELKRDVERWVYFLKHAEELNRENIPVQLETREIKKALEVLDMFTKDEKEWAMYIAKKMAILDYESGLSDRYDQGYEEGFKEGEIKGFKEGEIKGFKEGEIKGKIEGKIEMALEMKFGEEGLKLMEEIRTIRDIDKLEELKNKVKSSKTLEEFKESLK